jgi:hypothetical protein
VRRKECFILEEDQFSSFNCGYEKEPAPNLRALALGCEYHILPGLTFSNLPILYKVAIHKVFQTLQFWWLRLEFRKIRQCWGVNLEV